MFVGHSESKASFLFPRKLKQIERAYKVHFSNIVLTIDYAFLPVVDKNLHAMLIKICTSGDDQLFDSCYDHIVSRSMLPTQSISPKRC